MVGRRLLRPAQSRWIARQVQQYHSVPRTPETWRVLYAAFVARYPQGGLDGQRVTLDQYKGHARYVERKIQEESDADADADARRAQAHVIEHEQRVQEQLRIRAIKKRSTSDHQMKWETSVPKTLSPKARERPKLLRTRRTAEAFAAVEDACNGANRTNSYSPGDRRSSKRKRLELVDDDDVVIKLEGGLSQADLDRHRLETELRECQASLKRMKQSAHAWKVKYEELLHATKSLSPKATTSSDPKFSFTVNINVDVSQDGTHVRTDHHAMKLKGLCPTDKSKRRER